MLYTLFLNVCYIVTKKVEVLLYSLLEQFFFLKASIILKEIVSKLFQYACLRSHCFPIQAVIFVITKQCLCALKQFNFCPFILVCFHSQNQIFSDLFCIYSAFYISNVEWICPKLLSFNSSCFCPLPVFFII